MKTIISLLAVGMLPIAAHAEAPAKPAVTLTVKHHVLDSNYDIRGKQANTKEKTITLRVEIVNITSAEITDAELTGNALVTRSNDLGEKLIKEALGKMPVPAMKPNEKITIDLGKIQLRELEWRNRKFEEKLEEWQVECVQKQTTLGSAASGERYTTLEKTAVSAPANKVPAIQKRIRKLSK